MALRERSGDTTRLRLGVVGQAFPSVGAEHPPAIRLERAINDLFGFKALGAPDSRPWFDHGRWRVQAPLGESLSHADSPKPYEFLSAEGPGLHQIPVGPVHAGIIEPGHFRFHASGETIVRLEERLGYVHKGVDWLMRGADLTRGATLAGRVSGDSSVGYQVAFARAAEAALGVEAPARAHWLRALMAELERIANHLGDIGAVCNDASFALMLAHCGALRESALRAAETAFGHRLMMDTVTPGGARDLQTGGVEAISSFVGKVRAEFPRLVELYDNTASLQDRTVRTGVVGLDLVLQYGAGGYVGRASGRDFDVRRDASYAPYDKLNFDVPVRTDGDVNARVWVRIHEVYQSLFLIDQLLAGMPVGPTHIAARPTAGSGDAMVEAFRGDVFVSLRLDADGRIARAHLRDASWFQWPLLEVAIAGNIVADFPLCNKSFNCSYSGHDL